ncbi:hypothetical protein PAPYR_5081 [Paratrimastix pyriformis]|uniref:Uncharacterized protein n=1 Tax=Paratrimastix pyriformis TaxID=342808 RepID=A0ABQ8UQP4_9EUKA|nr:hypothetical protein PAPYR_5081 [Paratrimastix pyriformis]
MATPECAKFDQFNTQTYTVAYKADNVYALLGNYLDKYVRNGMHIIEVGCGANVPGLSWCSKNRNVTADIYEPSDMFHSAAKLIATLPGAAGYQAHHMAADDIPASNPRKGDVLIFNRMLHEWRLYELKRTGSFDLAVELRKVAHACLNPGGIVILGDFSIPDGLPQAQLTREMEALRIRIGHTHPPQDYVTLPQANIALREAPCSLAPLTVLESSLLNGVEHDTSRVYWMTAARL